MTSSNTHIKLIGIWLLCLTYFSVGWAQDTIYTNYGGEAIVLDGGSSVANEFLLEWKDEADVVFLDAEGKPIATPTVSPVDPTTYTLTYISDATNLINNGDFESPPVGAWTDYTEYSTTTPNSCVHQGYFLVSYSTDFLEPNLSCYSGGAATAYENWYQPIYDHTKNDGSGNMFFANGATTLNQLVFETSAPVESGKSYALIFYIANIHISYLNPPIMDFYIDGDYVDQLAAEVVSNDGTNDIGTGGWERFYGLWESNTNGTISIQWRNKRLDNAGNDFAIDDIALLPSATKTITIIPPNTPPIVTDTTYNIPSTELLTGNLNDRAIDPNSADVVTITSTPTQTTSHGDLTINPDGTFEYQPYTTATAIADEFKFTACDGDTCIEETIYINVIPASRPITPDYFYETYQAYEIKDNIMKGVSSTSGYPITLDTIPSLAPKHGSVTINSDGSFNYVPSTEFVETEDSFKYIVCDSINICNTGTVYISVDATPKVTIESDDSFCEGINPMPIYYRAREVDPDKYTTQFDTEALDAGFTDSNPREDIIIQDEFYVETPIGATPSNYSGLILLEENIVRTKVYPLVVPIKYPASILVQKWNNVIAILNENHNEGGWVFVDWKWFKNGDPIAWGTPILHLLDNGDVDSYAKYYAYLTEDNNNAAYTCPLRFTERDLLGVYPTLASAGEVIKLPIDADFDYIRIWDIQGNLNAEHNLQDFTNSIQAPEKKGFYIMEIGVKDGYNDINRLIVK